jgi:hypothetical protein
MMPSDEQIQAEWLATHKPTILPTMFAAAVTGAVPLRPASEIVIREESKDERQRKARARGMHVPNERRRREAQDRADRLRVQWLANPRPETIDALVLQERCSRGRVLEIPREQGCSVRKGGKQ